MHGQVQETTLGGLRVVLYPIYHPAAALYTPAMLRVLEEDFRQIPQLLGAPVEEEPQPQPVVAPVAPPQAAVQLGLF